MNIVPKSFSTAFFNWVDRRIPESNVSQLRQKNIYILPTRYGWLMLVILALILVAATNYQNNMGFLTGFILLAIGMLSIFYTYRNLRGLKLKVLKPTPVFVEQAISYKIEIDNSAGLIKSALGFGISSEQLVFADVEKNQKQVISVSELARQRGWHQPQRFLCASIYPFGIFRVWSWFKSPQKVLIYPKPVASPENINSVNVGDEEGNVSRKGTEDFHHLREYKVGDPIKQVMWKAYAREKGLLTKEFEDWIGEPRLLTWQSVQQYEKELAISYLTHAVLQADKLQQPYALQLPNQTIGQNLGKQHLHQCLKALALMP